MAVPVGRAPPIDDSHPLVRPNGSSGDRPLSRVTGVCAMKPTRARRAVHFGDPLEAYR